ncbi:hypothetical protein ACS0TY_027666 [Phlomoides rotata]
MFPNMPLQIAFHREFPLAQITKIVGVQAVLDHLSGAKKVHIIDLEIRSGVQWIVLMQALASQNEHFIEHLKIIVIGTKWTAMIEETGKQLASFAHSLHLNFSFKIVHVKDIMDLDTTLFDRADDESISVYASYTLMSIVGRVDRLDHLMAVMRSLRPCAMIVIEIEVNCNSPSFIWRFVESLFFFGAFFDSLANCFQNDETSRVNAESTWFGSSIRNVLTTEGEERKIRHVDMNVWRAFFARHNLVETELSISSLDQASMGLHNLPRGSSCTLNVDEKFISLPPLSHHPLTLPSDEDSKGVQLVQNLLYCAEKVADNQYERALKFLNSVSFRTGTPIQRLVFYFSEALLEKITNETGRIVPKHSVHREDALEVVMFPNMPLQITFHREFPLAQITKIVGVQAVLDHLSGAKKVHIIDLEIRSGVQWIILMQALASRNEHFIEHLKITVIGTKWTAMIEETGKQLASFAHSLHLNFSFKIVHVKDIMDLDTTLFDRAGDESVSIYASYTLMSIVGRVDRLDHLMAVMRSLHPCATIVIEIEVNCNSPSFIGRFVESLFFFGAFFDSLADCFKNDETSRVNVESTWFWSSIRNVLTTEGEERKIKHVDMNVWRAFFARHNLVEMELSVSSLDQASMGLHSLPRGSSCTLNMDGKSLILGWKGTPLISVSAWKFQ